jgi:hypothetical protein
MLTPRRIAWLIPALVMLAACGGRMSNQPAASSSVPSNPSQQPAAATRPAATNTAANSAVPSSAAASTTTLSSCTASGASPGFQAPGPGEPPAIASAAVANDDFTLVFAHGTPTFEVRPQSSAHFSEDPSGRRVTLAGSSGVSIILRGFRGDVQNYRGPTPLTSHGPLLLQVAEIGDFEGVVTWAAGLSAPSCTSVTVSGSTLTFHFIAVSGKG